MTLTELQQALSTIKRGKYTRITFVKTIMVEDKECVKTTNAIVRFVDYSHMKSTKERWAKNGKKASNNGSEYVEPSITFNTHKNAFYLGMAPTKKAHSVYTINGQVVSKEDFENLTHTKPSTIGDWMTKRIEDIVSIG